MKFAIVDDGRVVYTCICDEPNDEFMQSLQAQYPIGDAIFCSVAGHDEAIIALLKSYLPNMLVMPHGLTFPINFSYNLNELGADRIAAAVGARVLVPQGNLLVVDAGSCITYDFVSEDDSFRVGNIAPGYEMRLRAMHQFTGKLPIVEPTEPRSFMAQSTAEAMRAGAFNGVVAEIECYAQYFQQQNVNFHLILTGGISEMLHNRIKNANFVEPNLVLIGLNEILVRNRH